MDLSRVVLEVAGLVPRSMTGFSRSQPRIPIVAVPSAKDATGRRPAHPARGQDATIGILGWERENPVIETWNEACHLEDDG